MRVADFFCGAGGFSEGFRQAGFEIVFAVDKWKPAIDTFKANKPNCGAIQDDVIRISNLPDDEFHTLVPDTEIIIGSPPCIAFSNSNKSGNGDKSLGLALLKAYLKIIARKKFKENSVLRYWVLENVPNIKKYIKEKYHATDLDLDGDFFLIPINDSTGVYNAKYFGAPTNRKRFLCGEFPAPMPTNTDETVIKLRDVLNSLGVPQTSDESPITDCCYPSLSINRTAVTDHHYTYLLQPFEWETAKRLKVDKGYMGRMAFPENLNNPSRTVMATMSSSSRESMILATPDGEYRLPTVREAATMMSFPIDYQFYGLSKGTKHTLVGNAVPPKMSYALAKAMAFDSEIPIPEDYVPIQHDTAIEFCNLNNVATIPKVEKPKRDIAKFKYHIPYLIVKAFRVELTNYHSDFSNKKFRWNAEIHYSQGKKKAAVFTPKLEEVEIPAELQEKIQKYLHDITPKLLSFAQFQKVFCMVSDRRKQDDLLGPYELLESIKQFIVDAIPEEQWGLQYKASNFPSELPLAILVGYYILSQITANMEGINQ